MGFRWVVGQVVWVGFPLGFEVALLNAILNPVVAHVNCFATTDFGGAVGDLAGRSVVVGD